MRNCTRSYFRFFPGVHPVHAEAHPLQERREVPRGLDRPGHVLLVLPLLPPPRLRRPLQALARCLRLPAHPLPIVDAQGMALES